MTFFDCTADLVGQLNGHGQKGMLQIDAPPVENFWLGRWRGAAWCSLTSDDTCTAACTGRAPSLDTHTHTHTDTQTHSGVVVAL